MSDSQSQSETVVLQEKERMLEARIEQLNKGICSTSMCVCVCVCVCLF